MGGPNSYGGRDRLRYLDGLRAVAVSMVLAYHGGVPGLSTGGFYGVDVFFVLSGFLITSLLLRQYRDPAGIRFGAFWARRARRLLPALLVMLAVVDLYVAYLAPAGRYPGFRGDALSVLLYVSNWHFVAVSSNYFAASSPSLLTHTWSLAIEEQFYLLWPLVVWGAARAGRRARRLSPTAPATAVAVLAGLGALLSAGWMAIGYRAGESASRLYFGTDTHASSILVGALLGAVATRGGWPGSRRVRSGRSHRLITISALLALAGLGWAACSLGSSDGWAYQGGFLAVAVVTAALLAGVVAHPTGPVPSALALRPLSYIGRISYGMYLWYFPLFAVVDHAATGLSGGALFGLRVAADVAVAAASHHLVEVRFLRGRPPAAAGDRRAQVRPVVTVAAGVAAVAVLLSVTAPAGGFRVPAAEASSDLSGTGGRPGPGASQPGALRLMVTGDSTGLTLGLALAFPTVAQRYHLVVDDVGLLGCGLVLSAEIRDHGHQGPPPAPCLASAPPATQWPARLRAEVDAFHPDVVLVAAGRWELDSRRPRPGAAWTDISQAADQADVRAGLALAAAIARSGGARVALASAPCFDSGESPQGTPWAADSPARVAAYNRIVRSVVATTPGASVVDLHAAVCPGGRYTTTVGGVTVRAPDGIHYPFYSITAPGAADPDTEAQVQSFGMWMAPRVLADIGTTRAGGALSG